MSELTCSRRLFLKATAVTAATTIVGTELAWTSKIFNPKFKIQPDILPHLDIVAESISQDIIDNIYFITSADNYAVQAKIDPQTITKAITRMAYLDGGEERLAQIAACLNRYKLMFDVRDDPTLRAYMAFSLNSDERVNINIVGTPQEIQRYFRGLPKPDNDEVFYHEFYHLIQLVRDPQFTIATTTYSQPITEHLAPIISGAAMAIAQDSIFKSTSAIQDPLKRKIFWGIFGGGFLYALSRFSMNPFGAYALRYLSPIEQQANLQTGTYNLPALLDLNSLEPLRGKLFTFQRV